MLKRDKVDFDLTNEDMHHLWGSVHATRDSTSTVKVDKAILIRLLLDHGRLLNAYK